MRGQDGAAALLLMAERLGVSSCVAGLQEYAIKTSDHVSLRGAADVVTAAT